MAEGSPIQHVVIIVKENHTFDSYFGTFPGADGQSGLTAASDPPAADHLHDHGAWLKRKDPEPIGAWRQQYKEADIPGYFAYARQFTLCDNYFTDVASQSVPNHLMLIAATSPVIDNPTAGRKKYQEMPPFDLPSLPASLEQQKLTWRAYGGYYHKDILALRNSPNLVSSQQFDADIDAGNLPSVSWLYAPEAAGGGGLSEHPTESVRDGMLWTVARVNKVGQSKYWDATVIFVTWDDWGGWFDHVDPPNVQTWQGSGPAGYANSQFRYGSRVPCLVVSPYAKQGHISHTTLPGTVRSHVSLVRFCEDTFGLGRLGQNDATCDDMSDCFDFTATPAGPPAWQPGAAVNHGNPPSSPRRHAKGPRGASKNPSR